MLRLLRRCLDFALGDDSPKYKAIRILLTNKKPKWDKRDIARGFLPTSHNTAFTKLANMQVI
jgi:hypothetical protein